MFEPTKETFWESLWGIVLEHYIPGIVILILAILNEAISSPNIQIKVLLYGMYALTVAVMIYFDKKLKENAKNLEETRNTIASQNLKSNNEIAKQNSLANNELVRIATKDIEEKIFRKLVSTNAVIPDRDHKVAITARILDDFPNKNVYKLRGTHKKTTESIDLIRVLSYQNLLLTPKYLEYFFYRKDSVKKATRIIVLDREQINENVCQATLTYVFISARYGYETYILPEKRFRKLLKQKTYSNEDLKMIKGNPFILKITDESGEKYQGEYTNYQENIENNGEIVNIDSEQLAWQILNNIKDNSTKIEAKDLVFAEHIKAAVSRVNSNRIV